MKEILKTHDTFPKLLVRNAETFGDRKVAMREKEFGIWQEFTWKEYHDHVKYFSLGMVSLGLQAGDKVAIIGDNRPEWVWGEVAAQAAGAVPLGLYQDSTLKEVSYIIDHSDASFVLAEDQEQVDKILDMKEQLPKVRYIIYSDPRGMRGYKQPFLLDFKEVENFGRELEQRDPGLFAKNVAATKYEDLAFICYTSGTTGFPKGAMLSFRNFLSMAANLMEVDNKFEKDEFVSFLPLAWIGEQMMCLSSALLTGFTVNFPEKPETVQENIREIGPTIMFSPPRIWENMTSTVQVKVMDASALKRRMYNWALPVGYAYADAVFRKEAIPPLAAPEAEAGLRPRLPGAEGPARPAAHPVRLHRRRGAGARRLQVLQRDGREPEADLRPDGDLRHLVHPPRRRHQLRLGRQADPRDGDPALRHRRDPVALPVRLPRLLQEPRGDGKDA